MDPVLQLATEVIDMQKQALVFCNSKRSAEKQAEDIAKKLAKTTEGKVLSEEFLSVLPHPTEQCKRDAYCLSKGIAFHHAGLVTKQREIIEDGFKSGAVKVICATPTLAAGVDTAAFRTVIRDVKRYAGKWGMQYIPVLEYQQMAGRAGRPGKETFGQAVLIAKSEGEKQKLYEQYVLGEAEDIQSKLAVEPVLRTVVLSLVATGFTTSYDSLIAFFKKTFYAHQFGDLYRLEQIVSKVISMLRDWGFLEDSSDSKSVFSSADELDEQGLSATPLGRRVSELYIDPLTAHHLITCLNRASEKLSDSDYLVTPSLLHMLCHTIEMEPLLRVKQKELDSIHVVLSEYESSLLIDIPNEYDYEFEKLLQSTKTTLFFNAWINEVEEEEILKRFDVRPGETRAKLDGIDWLLRCAIELAKFLDKKTIIGSLAKLNVRLINGAKEELLPLLKIKGVGRVRARVLFNAGFTQFSSFTQGSFSKVKELVGDKIAENIYKQLDVAVKRNDLTDFM